MNRDRVLLAAIIALVNIVFAGWWYQLLARPGVPRHFKTGMTACMVILAVISVTVFLALGKPGKK
ncbi:MAG: hypothetical protein MUD12_11295 [Spirochaetes bacterium]|jgi:formate hydrogenlyase subunit 3/multisubunit Na+/H+ antiporter MnhD subunit|nr:hypothetical protein [Spirochaetota bacterium]